MSLYLDAVIGPVLEADDSCLAVAECRYCAVGIGERDLVLTKRGPMHEDCAEAAFDHADFNDPGIPAPGM